MNTKNISIFLLNLRKQENLMQKDIANLCNVSVQAVSKWERGESIPDIQILEKLSILYKVSINEIINGEKLEIYTDIEKRNSIFNLTSSILVLVAFLFTFAKTPNISEYYGMNVVLKGYEVIFNGISGLFVYLTWAQFAVLFSHLLLNVFLITKVINKSNSITKYFVSSSSIVIIIGIFGVLTGNLYLFPQIIIFSAMVTNLILSGVKIATLFSPIRKEEHQIKLDKLSESLVIATILFNTLMTGIAIFETLDDRWIYPYGSSELSWNPGTITVSILFVIATIGNIIFYKNFKYKDRVLVSIRFGLLNLVFPAGLMFMNNIWQMNIPLSGYVVMLLQVIIPVLIIARQSKANPS